MRLSTAGPKGNAPKYPIERDSSVSEHLEISSAIGCASRTGSDTAIVEKLRPSGRDNNPRTIEKLKPVNPRFPVRHGEVEGVSHVSSSLFPDM